MNDRPQVNIRLDRVVLDQIDEIAASEHADRSDVARRLIGSGLTSYRMESSLRDYRRGAVSMSRAAELAGVSLYDMLDRIHSEGIPYELDTEALRRLDAGRAPAVRETRPAYGGGTSDAESGVETLRSQFKPQRVKWMFVGESSPAGGTHFYRANSNLFRATREAFEDAYGAEHVPNGANFLPWFRDQGCWLVDLANRPVNRLDPIKRSRVVTEGVGPLADLIHQTEPEVIVAVKASISPAIREAIAAAEWRGEFIELPFPVRQWRGMFVSRLSSALRKLDANGAQPS